MHDELTAVVTAWPGAIVVPSTEGAIQQSYQALTAALGSGPEPAPPEGEAEPAPPGGGGYPEDNLQN